MSFPAWGRGVAGQPLGCWGGTLRPGTRHAAGGLGPGSWWHFPGGARRNCPRCGGSLGDPPREPEEAALAHAVRTPEHLRPARHGRIPGTLPGWGRAAVPPGRDVGRLRRFASSSRNV